MKRIDSFVFLFVGAFFGLLSLVLPEFFPAGRFTSTNTRALWLEVMGTVMALISAIYWTSSSLPIAVARGKVFIVRWKTRRSAGHLHPQVANASLVLKRVTLGTQGDESAFADGILYPGLGFSPCNPQALSVTRRRLGKLQQLPVSVSLKPPPSAAESFSSKTKTVLRCGRPCAD